ncbi:hypothetical protein SRB5_64190 [Streptomyces sp. RB5]|uniref:Lipoprotein n=1 Tax=Streptomyces smaragdinus TaxID=2585196 RepID=A0A7K0CS01_9ACTN|nr:hypothetical protein [Streptomyces smaragdinus]MQY16221.1 hypothetical protein [Streptomyces smaragdinus]
MRTQQLCWPTALCTAAVLVLTGCTGEDPEPFAGQSARTVVEKAVKATKAVDSVSVGRIAETGNGRTTGRLSLNRDNRCTATVDTTERGRFEFRRTGDAVYIRPDETFVRSRLKGQPRIRTEAMRGRWLKMPPDSVDAEDLGEICEFAGLMNQIHVPEKSNVLRRGKIAEVGGQRTLEIMDSLRDGGTSRIYVATEGEPYIVKIVKVGGDESGTITFSDYNKPVEVQAPPADQVIDGSRFGG